ncbi:MAG: UDP-N-acetylmuramate--L-alanine ligase [Candidatus Nanopelagicales bacterium]
MINNSVHPLGTVFIVGIGGAGMSALARILLAQGAVVRGSDAKDSRRIQKLRSLGIDVVIGHTRENLVGESGVPLCDTICYSTAIPTTNIERVTAGELGIRSLSRAELLVQVTQGTEVLSVTGTHGKTTTTSLLTLGLQSAGVDPSFVVGSELHDAGSNAHWGSGKYFAVEADESDGTFLQLQTGFGIITNVEADHLNYWHTLEKLEAAFCEFISKTQNQCVVHGDDEGIKKILLENSNLLNKVQTYGMSDHNDFQVNISRDSAEVHGKDGIIADFTLQIPGVHNILNASATIVLAHLLELDMSRFVKGIESFTGTSRRFELKGKVANVSVYDDYAHHPTEIRATLTAAREKVKSGKLIVAFQAHHYYRTALFSKEFGESLGLADEVVVMEVFAPGEEFIPGSSGITLASNVPLDSNVVHFEPSWSKVPALLARNASPGDFIFTLGAGEIGLMSSDIVRELKNKYGE